MYESSRSLFFRHTPGIQSRPDAFAKSRLAMTFLSKLRATVVLCKFSLFQKGKQVKKHVLTRLVFLEKISENLPLQIYLCCRQCQQFVNSHVNQMFGKRQTFFFISIRKFGSFKNSFTTIASISGCLFRCRIFVLMAQRSNFYELQQQQKQLKTLEINEA